MTPIRKRATPPPPWRHIGGSLLPSSSALILQPMKTRLGTFQVRAFPDLDTHILFLNGSAIAEHANAYSLHNLAERMDKGDEVRTRQQAQYIQDCGGMTRHHDHLIAMTEPNNCT